MSDGTQSPPMLKPLIRSTETVSQVCVDLIDIAFRELTFPQWVKSGIHEMVSIRTLANRLSA